MKVSTDDRQTKSGALGSSPRAIDDVGREAQRSQSQTDLTLSVGEFLAQPRAVPLLADPSGCLRLTMAVLSVWLIVSILGISCRSHCAPSPSTSGCPPSRGGATAIRHDQMDRLCTVPFRHSELSNITFYLESRRTGTNTPFYSLYRFAGILGTGHCAMKRAPISRVCSDRLLESWYESDLANSARKWGGPSAYR